MKECSQSKLDHAICQLPKCAGCPVRLWSPSVISTVLGTLTVIKSIQEKGKKEEGGDKEEGRWGKEEKKRLGKVFFYF